MAPITAPTITSIADSSSLRQLIQLAIHRRVAAPRYPRTLNNVSQCAVRALPFRLAHGPQKLILWRKAFIAHPLLEPVQIAEHRPKLVLERSRLVAGKIVASQASPYER